MRGEGAARLALEVYREPQLRHRLRARPVPDGTGELLALAGGAGPRQARLADAVGADADELLQAARFFVREVLLHPGADAYRVLGVAADAEAATIKANYRLLQRWLHPDRLGNAPESVYSRRVNQAWARLRTSAARKAYDHARPDAPGPGPAPDVEISAPAARLQRWQRVTEHGRWMARPQSLLPLGLLLLCGGLLLLATREGPVPTLPEPMAQAAAIVQVLPASADPPTATAPASVAHTPPRKAAVVASEAVPKALQPEAPVESLVANTVAEPMPAPAPVPAMAVLAAAVGAAPVHPIVTGRRQPPPVQPAPVTHTMPRTSGIGLAPSSGVLAHARSARERGDELLGYVTRKRDGTPPPIWHGMAALDQAERIRMELTGGSLFRRPRVDIEHAHWTLGTDQAQLQVPVIAADRALGPHVLGVGLRWKDDAWWVESVTMEAMQ